MRDIFISLVTAVVFKFRRGRYADYYLELKRLIILVIGNGPVPAIILG
jgi:hypothetical protein